ALLETDISGARCEIVRYAVRNPPRSPHRTGDDYHTVVPERSAGWRREVVLAVDQLDVLSLTPEKRLDREVIGSDGSVQLGCDYLDRLLGDRQENPFKLPGGVVEKALCIDSAARSRYGDDQASGSTHIAASRAIVLLHTLQR